MKHLLQHQCFALSWQEHDPELRKNCDILNVDDQISVIPRFGMPSNRWREKEIFRHTACIHYGGKAS